MKRQMTYFLDNFFLSLRNAQHLVQIFSVARRFLGLCLHLCLSLCSCICLCLQACLFLALLLVLTKHLSLSLPLSLSLSVLAYVPLLCLVQLCVSALLNSPLPELMGFVDMHLCAIDRVFLISWLLLHRQNNVNAVSPSSLKSNCNLVEKLVRNARKDVLAIN